MIPNPERPEKSYPGRYLSLLISGDQDNSYAQKGTIELVRPSSDSSVMPSASMLSHNEL